MPRIVPKLNLNKTPQIVENYSLIFAKNIKVLKDGCIVKDNGIKDITPLRYYTSTGYTIVGYIPYNTCIFVFMYNTRNSLILKYDELNPDNVDIIDCNWNYSGGNNFSTEISGEVIVNLNSDIILVITESGNPELNVPIKFININRSSADDDETIYTQSPKMPVLNLLYKDKYTKVIPNGVYQFFVRYEIKKGFYTKWIPCSKELYSGTTTKSDTLQGSVKYVNLNSDSSESFVFTVDKLTENNYNYKSFQIGFILSHDDSTVARAWKHFSFNTETIYFDYDKNYIEEVNIDDMLDSVYQIYNVDNITSFKNKIYISNYKESNINPDLSEYYKDIEITLNEVQLNSEEGYKYKGNPISSVEMNNDSLGFYQFEGDDSEYKFNFYRELFVTNRLHSYFRTTKEETILNADTIVTEEPDSQTGKYHNNIDEVATAVVDYFGLHPIAYRIKSVTVEINGTTYDVISEEQTYNYEDYINKEFDPRVEVMKLLSNSNDDNIKCCYFDKGGYLYNVNKDRIDKIEIHYTGLSYASYNTYMVRGQETLVGGFDLKWYNPTGFYDNNTYYYEIKYYDRELRYRSIINTSYLFNKAIDFDYQTLIPFKTYAFYIHYVKETGETTNGYFLGEKLAYITNTENIDKLIYPSFSGIKYPDEYPYCFISIADTKNNVAQIFGGNNCLDIDTLLLPINTNIRTYSIDTLKTFLNIDPETSLPRNYSTYFDVYENNPNAILKYLYSGRTNANALKYFGASGKLVNSDDTDCALSKHFIVNQKEENQEYIALTKCTPYIKDSFYNDYNNCNLLGYICSVYKPTANELARYISGSDVFDKDIEGSEIQLTQLTTGVYNTSTNPYVVYSEFNLNYLSLVNDISTRIVGIKETDGTNDNNSSAQNTKLLVQSFESLTLADVYELKAMYKDYRKKLFYPKQSDTIIDFNNTIRSSEVFSDEGVTYILKFEATQYYNVPTNKGYITNLKAIADKILVHTQDSLFGFSGSSKLNTQEGNAQLSESDPFDTGITELFGSEHGFVGLSNKNHTMLCYDGYFFFDKEAKTIYDYNGQGLTLISDPIERLLNYNEIVDVIFANDYYNDRFFMTLKYKRIENIPGYDYVTLSFNYKQKTFVSLHDFTFEKSFSTKTNCYFIKNNTIYVIDKDPTNYTYGGLEINDIIYPSGLEPIIGEQAYQKKAIVDVIFNDSYEVVKTLNAISWIGASINDEFNYLTRTITQQGETVIEPKHKSPIADLVAEAIYSNNALVDYIRVYSESCCTELNNITSDNYYDKTPLNPNDYKYPSYNNGVWTYNYLRNILDNKNTKANGKLISDESSLIYGKYFVVRFVFNHSNNFKLENVIFNI